MNIGLLTLSTVNNGKSGYYNSQDIGLAKALAAAWDKVILYSLVSRNETIHELCYDWGTNVIHKFIPALHIGNNGIIRPDCLDSDLNCLVCFSDNQLAFPSVQRWANKHHILLLPYIGVMESNSSNPCKRLLMQISKFRNIKSYQSCSCLVKTPSLVQSLKQYQIPVFLAPVGLDLSLLHDNFLSADKNELKRVLGYLPEHKILLFIGRLEPEKEPIQLIKIFSELVTADPAYRLLIIGNGSEKSAVCQAISEYHLDSFVQLTDQVKNSDIWQYYRICDTFLNLNRHEIFGMAILEAMYYCCNVVAWHAPGPDFLIEDQMTGYLIDHHTDIVTLILHSKHLGENAHHSVLQNFTWHRTAAVIMQLSKRSML